MKSRRGMMMVVAIVLLGLIGVALAGLTQQFALDLQRVQTQTDAAQARLILIASTRDLLTNPDRAVSMPAELRAAGAQIKVSAVSQQPTRRVLAVEVICHRFHAAETLTLQGSSGHWTIADVDLR